MEQQIYQLILKNYGITLEALINIFSPSRRPLVCESIRKLSQAREIHYFDGGYIVVEPDFSHRKRHA